MLEEFLGKKVVITTGETTSFNLRVIDIDSPLIKVQDSQGDIRVINTTSADFSEIRLQD